MFGIRSVAIVLIFYLPPNQSASIQPSIPVEQKYLHAKNVNMTASNHPFLAAYSLTIFEKSLISIDLPWSSKLLPIWRNRSSCSRVKSCGLPRRPGIGLSSRRKMVVFDTLYFIAAENADNPRILISSNANFRLGFMVQKET